MKLNISDYQELSKEFKIPVPNIKTIVVVESGSKGFDETTGKILIQFEPSWFKRKSPYTPSGKWSVNGVERQKEEWIAFTDAFKKDANAAMESTSIGMMQVMGFHFKKLGFKTVGDMWDFAKKSEKNQLWLGLKFIQLNPILYNALINKDWNTVAYHYNGENYKAFNYHTKLADAYLKSIKFL